MNGLLKTRCDMRIGGLQKFSLIDYPGKVSAVIFTRGCNFRCPYCQNPELVLPERFGHPVPEEFVLSFLQTREGLLEGVVVTGGEPTLQGDLISFLKKLRRMSYAIKLDTNGSRPEVLEKIFVEGLVDYVAMDIKAPLEKYDFAVGVKVNTELIKKSIELILGSEILYQFRTTVVKPLCPSEDLREIVALIPGAQHYVIQPFVASEKILDKNLLDQPQYSEEEINRFKARWEIHPHAMAA